MARFDLVVRNGTLVVPFIGTVRADVAAREGRIAQIADEIDSSDAETLVDATDKLVFPGGVDAHFHIGIYRPVAEDAESETRSALVGGVTSVVSYFRTGSHYLNRSGPYREIFPEVLQATDGHAYTDFGYHIAIMTSQQVEEVDWLVREMGVGSFKYYMFYKGLNLAASSTDAAAYTMSDVYDLGHLYRFMQAVSAASQRYGSPGGRISLSIHCEQPEIIRTMIDEVKAQGLEGLEAYSRARPAFQERLAIAEAVLLADQTRCPVNLLHLSSAEALDGGRKARLDYPDLDIRLETTLHHLCLTYATARGGIEWGKVNPPIRAASDNEALWRGIARGDIQQVASDHACCMEEIKHGGTWEAQPGFGGTALLYPILVSEGHFKRGLPLQRVAEMVAAQPAQTVGVYPRKGTIAVGRDADLTVVDPELEAVVSRDRLLSAQDHTTFDGYRLKGWPTHTIRAGRVVYANGEVVGTPDGRYLKRPDVLHSRTGAAVST
ncbi:MAG: dihydroorotase family protein [Chloroflexi bacterium]|nr:dihydroorotase family protein [Chloroflexota bacterium]MBV9601981.1 dihydroorotase family protein [Chloroflexota bacterium]